MVVVMARQTSLDHRQQAAPNASTGATSAFQLVQRTDNAEDHAINALRNDSSASDAAVLHIS